MLARGEMLRKIHLRDEFYRRRARQSFAEFLRYTKPDYQLSWFHEELAGNLDQFLGDVLQKRLIINCPPRKAKANRSRAGFRPHNSARVAAMVGSVGGSIGQEAWKNGKNSTKKKLASQTY